MSLTSGSAAPCPLPTLALARSDLSWCLPSSRRFWPSSASVERRRLHAARQRAGAFQRAAEVGAEHGQLGGVDAPVELVARGAETAARVQHVGADVQVDVGVRDVLRVGRQFGVAPQRRVRQRRRLQRQVERAAPVGAEPAAGVERAVDTARQEGAEGGRIEALRGAAGLDFDDARAAGRPAPAMLRRWRAARRCRPCARPAPSPGHWRRPRSWCAARPWCR